MKSVLVIGLGRFGMHLIYRFHELGDQVMAIDLNEEKIHEAMPFVVSAKIANCAKEETVKSLGVRNFDICFVCVGHDFQSSLEITCLLKEMGANRVISKASNAFHAKFLEKNGADEVVYPEKYSAEKFATKYSVDNVFDYIELTDDTAIYEIPVVPSWIGKSIVNLDIRQRYKINILAIKKDENIQAMPGADYVFATDDHLVILGHQKDVEKLLRFKENKKLF
ncbi:MAG: TrkA family potassium uptake protein [Oscillospiraceae bacterium]|nr:TrkA family potassium uptake protein [Oscillospiraceae bacterium]